MAITTRSYSITVGTAQALEIAQGEDRRFVFTFTEPGATSAKDFTGGTAFVMTVKDANDALLFARSYTSGSSTLASGILAFDILQADTATEAVQTYNVDVTWTDASGYKEQVLVRSRFLILKGVGASGDSVTTPPAIPVVYGLNWRDGWSSPSGGYLLNDAVFANDGSLGASALGVTCISTFRCIASGTTYYPINASLGVATGWQYVGQHGGAGVSGATATLQSAYNAGRTISLTSGIAQPGVAITWNAIATGYTAQALVAQNSTAATAGTQEQNSPCIFVYGAGWDGSTSKTVGAGLQARINADFMGQGSALYNPVLVLVADTNDIPYADLLKIYRDPRDITGCYLDAGDSYMYLRAPSGSILFGSTSSLTPTARLDAGLWSGNSFQCTATGTRPSASVTHRGRIYVEQGGAGARDRAYVCLKGDAGGYSWIEFANGGA